VPDLVELAVEQIVEDVQNGITDAIYAMLMNVKAELIKEFLVTKE
jgi:hypothetical protein